MNVLVKKGLTRNKLHCLLHIFLRNKPQEKFRCVRIFVLVKKVLTKNKLHCLICIFLHIKPQAKF